MTIILFLLQINSSFFELSQNTFDLVVFESRARGGNFSIKIKNDSVHFSENGSVVSSAIESKDWEAVVKKLQKITVTNISSYTAATSRRVTDAAWHSSIMIRMNGLEYSTTIFDDRNAPEPLIPLMKCINRLEKHYRKGK